MFTNVSER